MYAEYFFMILRYDTISFDFENMRVSHSDSMKLEELGEEDGCMQKYYCVATTENYLLFK
jgi:hypothetical protein